MPLILLTGLPNSGKTAICQDLIKKINEFFDNPEITSPLNFKPNIIYHSDETLSIPPESYYNPKLEKFNRGKIQSIMRRDVNLKNIVIVNSLNYIKGYRYQLFIDCKNFNEGYCLVYSIKTNDTDNSNTVSVGNLLELSAAGQLDTGKEHSVEEEGKEGNWDKQLINEISLRFEEPNERNRWDSPCFRFLQGQDKVTDEVVVEILKCLYPKQFQKFVMSKGDGNISEEESKKLNDLAHKMKPSNTTKLQPITQNDYLMKLNNITSVLIKKLSDWLNLEVNSMNLRYLLDDEDVERGKFIQFQSPLVKQKLVSNLNILQRLKRQFIQLHKIRKQTETDQKSLEDNIERLFMDFLTKNFAEL
ncbi:hypothetical protein ACO0SA_002414 [Hanseniaspora valbyensis]